MLFFRLFFEPNFQQTKAYGRQRLLGQKPMISECAVQCDTHFVESFIDKQYEWNEWELRRKALMLVWI